jgi:hypothetical protein
LKALRIAWRVISPYAASAYCIFISLILAIGWRAVGGNYDLNVITVLFTFTWPFWAFPHWACGELLWGDERAMLLGGPLIGFLIDGVRFLVRNERLSRI